MLVKGAPGNGVYFQANITGANLLSCHVVQFLQHYNDVIMGAIASQITSLAIVFWTVYSDADQRKHQSSASLAFVRGIHRGPVNSPHKCPVTRKMFPFDDVIMFMWKRITRRWNRGLMHFSLRRGRTVQSCTQLLIHHSSRNDFFQAWKWMTKMGFIKDFTLLQCL